LPKISRERREARRMQILEAAWRCFYRKGLHEATMQDIIRTSGLSAGAVYLYFPSKEKIILDAIQTSLGAVRMIVTESVEKDDYDSLTHLLIKLATAIDTFAVREGYDLRSIALLGWSEAQTNDRVREVMLPIYNDFLAQFRAAVRRGQKRGIAVRDVSANAAASVFLSLLMGNVVQAALLGNNPTRLVLRGTAGLQPLKVAKRRGEPC